MSRWQELLSLLEVHRDKLERYCTIISLQREIETLSTTIKYANNSIFVLVVIINLICDLFVFQAAAAGTRVH